jgi:hypothetical protein
VAAAIEKFRKSQGAGLNVDMADVPDAASDSKLEKSNPELAKRAAALREHSEAYKRCSKR